MRVSVIKNGELIDPTDDTVEIALPAIGVDPTDGDDQSDPVIESDWTSGGWDTVDDEFFARILVGPDGDIELGVGDYDIYVRITDTPEIPVIRAGVLHVT